MLHSTVPILLVFRLISTLVLNFFKSLYHVFKFAIVFNHCCFLIYFILYYLKIMYLFYTFDKLQVML